MIKILTAKPAITFKAIINTPIPQVLWPDLIYVPVSL